MVALILLGHEVFRCGPFQVFSKSIKAVNNFSHAPIMTKENQNAIPLNKTQYKYQYFLKCLTFPCGKPYDFGHGRIQIQARGRMELRH